MENETVSVKFEKMENEGFPHEPPNLQKSESFRYSKGFKILMFGLLLFILGVIVLCVSLSNFETDSKVHEETTTDQVPNPICSGISHLEKYDCHPEGHAQEEQCILRGCCWQVTNEEDNSRSGYTQGLNVPSCYHPKNYLGYKVISITSTSKSQRAILQRVTPSGFPRDIANLSLVITYLNENSIRVKITDNSSKRFEVPLSQREHSDNFDGNVLYSVHLNYNGNLTVIRKSNGAILFSTDLSLLVYSDQFLQLSTRLPSPIVYGLGEQYDHFLRSVHWSRSTLFNRGIFPNPNVNLYGTHPFYVSVENDGNSHGSLFLNSNSMDIILQPLPALTFRTIGGILDVFIFLGPSPDEVVQQYSKVVGLTFMPPYWSLGFHLCKYGYDTLNETKKVWKRTMDAGIPFDVQWNDIDYMDKYNDFSYDKVNYSGLPEFIQELHDNDMYYVMIVDPGVSNTEAPGTYPPYDEGMKADIFVKNSSGDVFIGKVWNKVSTVFPDFSHPATLNYWRKMFRILHQQIPFDGAWIDMNEPDSFYDGQIDGCPQNSSLEDPPYLPGGFEPLRTQTLCMTAKHYAAPHYDEHSLYAYREAAATFSALYDVTRKRPFLISRASISGQGYFGGHWSGDIKSDWEDLRYSVISLMNFNIFAIPMMGSDICGFAGNTTVELCARWSAVGAFYPFSRNHNDFDNIDQDPVALGPEVVNATKKSLLKRYTLLPYLYTLFYRSHAFGETVVRPLVFEYPKDTETFNKEESFMWGPAFMVIPVLYPGVSSVVAYFPKDLWYEFSTGERKQSTGQNFTLDTPLTEINLFVRGGFILPLQSPNLTTTASRRNPFTLFVALNDEKEAVGELFWDDGETFGTYLHEQYNLVQFSVRNNTLTTTAVLKKYSTSMPLSVFKIYGLTFKPSGVTVNGNQGSYKYDGKYDCLLVEAKGLSLLNHNVVSWK